jgi:hypothetical protein
MSDVDLELKIRVNSIVEIVDQGVRGLKSFDLEKIAERYIDVCRKVCQKYPDVTEEQAKMSLEVYKSYEAQITIERSPSNIIRLVGLFVSRIGRSQRQDILGVLSVLPSYIKHESLRREKRNKES